MVKGTEFRVRAWGSGFGVEDLRFKVYNLGSECKVRVCSLWVGVEGLGSQGSEGGV
jgi:hypothetical protein